MKVTRDVILDILPLYLGDEVSDDTRTLVREYLETDDELLEIAERSRTTMGKHDVPVPLNKEDRMQAYEEAKHAIYKRIITYAAIFGVLLFAVVGTALLLAFFMLKS